MRSNVQEFDFPLQRIPSDKKDAAWAANCCDWIIAQGIANRGDNSEIEIKYAILNGNIPDEFYKKIWHGIRGDSHLFLCSGICCFYYTFYFYNQQTNQLCSRTSV